MKLFSVLLLVSMAAPAFGKGNDLNCEVTLKSGVVKHVHAKSQATCEKRKGKWTVVVAPATPAPAASAPAATPAPAAATPAPATPPADAPKK